MESRVNYIIVGIFVVFFSLGLAGFAFWYIKYAPGEYLLKYHDGSEYEITDGQFVVSVETLARSLYVRLFGRKPESDASDRTKTRDKDYIAFYNTTCTH